MVCMVYALYCRGALPALQCEENAPQTVNGRRGYRFAAGSRPRRGRLPHGNILGSCTRYRVFVGEAYMPPGRGAPSRGGCGKIDRLPRFVGRGLGPAAHYYF